MRRGTRGNIRTKSGGTKNKGQSSLDNIGSDEIKCPREKDNLDKYLENGNPFRLFPDFAAIPIELSSDGLLIYKIVSCVVQRAIW